MVGTEFFVQLAMTTMLAANLLALVGGLNAPSILKERILFGSDSAAFANRSRVAKDVRLIVESHQGIAQDLVRESICRRPRENHHNGHLSPSLRSVVQGFS